ncbi:MAG: hypothetical protein HYZ19_04520 [Rhodocyclales bacterium]|nr:hypothetical protein [Rhodocyclales bacterium]
MLQVSLTFDLTLLSFAVVTALAIAVYALVLRRRAEKIRAATAQITRVVRDYFAKSGAEVAVQSVHQAEGNHFLVFIESEPLKRFRYSHIVEAALVSHVDKILGHCIDRVYWRFPLPAEPTPAAATAPGAAESKAAPAEASKASAAEKSLITQEDEYIAQGLLRAKATNDYHVVEGSWDQFEQALQKGEAASESPQDGPARP